MEQIKLLFFTVFTLLSVEILSGAPCSGCRACACGGSVGTKCVKTSTASRSTGPIKELPFVMNETVDKGCFGSEQINIDLKELKGTIKILNTTQPISKIPQDSITGKTDVGQCRSCGGCRPCPPPPSRR